MIEKFINRSFNTDSVLRHKNQIILTFITHEFCTMLLNWYKHLEKLNIQDRVIVVCMDAIAYEFAVNNNMACMHIDQDAIVNDQSEEVITLKKTYIEKHHICKALCVGHITTKYNTGIIHSDIDMIFLKSPFERLDQLIGNEYDMGAYMDLSYEELTSGIPREKGGFGFILFYAAPSWFPKFLQQQLISPLLIDHNDVGQLTMQKHFKTIKTRWLNSFLFTNYSIWKVKEVQNKIRDVCYCVHYNTSENTWMHQMTFQKIKNRNEIKVERMKENGHWLI